MKPRPPAAPASTEATFAPLTLQQRTSASYALASGTPAQLAAHLEAAGFRPIPICAESEAARLRHRNGGLAVVYHSGTLLCQGQAAAVHAAVAALVEAEQEGGQPW